MREWEGLGPELGIHWAQEMSIIYYQQMESQVLDRALLSLGPLMVDKVKRGGVFRPLSTC